MGQKDGEDDDQRHAHHGIEHRVLQRQPEGVVLQQVLIVLQADEGPLPEGPHLPKAVEDILNEGNDTEQQQSRKHGQDEDVRSAHLRASEPAEMPCLIFHGRSSCFPRIASWEALGAKPRSGPKRAFGPMDSPCPRRPRGAAAERKVTFSLGRPGLCRTQPKTSSRMVCASAAPSSMASSTVFTWPKASCMASSTMVVQSKLPLEG